MRPHRKHPFSGNLRHLVTLALLASAASLQAQIFWDGSTSANWGTTSNWDLLRVPNSTEQVTFPSSGANKTMSNNRAAGTAYTRLTFSGSGYFVNGSNSFTMSGVGTPLIEATHTSGTTTLNCPIALGEATTFASTGFSTFPLTSGTLLIGGNVDLGVHLLTLNASTGIIDVNGTLSGSGGVTTTGNSLVRFDGNQLFTGLTTVSGTSDLRVNGSMAGGVSVGSSGTLAGTGTIGDTISDTVSVQGDVRPGVQIGRLTITGDLLFDTGTEDDAFFDMNNTTAATDHDQIRVGDAVTPNGARINLLPTKGFPIGSSFILIDKTSVGPMSTGFRTSSGTTISENTQETLGMNVFRYNYTGGTGNDFTATTVLSTSSGTREWDGGGSTTSWTNVTNWNGDVAPVASNTVIFGLLPPSNKRSIVGDSGGNAFALSFTDGGYSIAAGLELTLSNGISATNASGTNTITTDLILGAAQTIAMSNAGNLTVTDISNGGFALTANSNSSGTLGFDGAITGGGAFIKNGSGLAVLSGSVANTYGGTTTINSGELRLTKSSGNAIPGNVTIGNGSSTASLTTTVTEKIADAALVTVSANATFAPAALETIGGLVLDGGAVNGGASILAIAGNITANQTSAINSPIRTNGSIRDWTVASTKTLTLNGAFTISPAGSGVTQRKTGAGTLIISGNAAVTTFNLEQGTLQLDNPSETLTLGISLNGGTLSGSGRAVRITASAGGVISPGIVISSAIFKATQLTANSTTTLEFDLNGATAGSGHDQLDIAASSIDPIAGGVTLANAALVIRDSVTLPPGTAITLIKNDNTDVVSGTFAGLAQGSSVATGFNRFSLSYTGGTGNDVTLTSVTPAASGITRIWDGGGGADTSWLTAANWAGDVVPAPGDSLEFPSAVHVASTNNFPAGMIFHSLTFSGVGSTSAARLISGNAIQLTGNITCNVSDSTARLVDIFLPITLLSDASITNTNQRSLRFRSPLITTTANLRFRGDGTATQRNITFSTGGLLSGPATVRVEANANTNLDGSIAHTYTGTSLVEFGNLTGRADVVTTNGLTLGTGASIATAFLAPVASPLSGAIVVNSQATLNFNGTTNQTIQNLQLNNGSISGQNLTFTGDLTIDGSDSLSLTTLACQNFTFNSGTCTISSALTCQGYAQSAPSLTVPSVTLAGNLTLGAGATLATSQFAVPNAAGTHTLALAAGSQITAGSFGSSILANQNFLVTGSGLLKVDTTLATDSLKIQGPELRHNGGIPESSPLKAQAQLDGGKISGSGLFRNIEVLAGGGQITPGTSPGILSSQAAQLNSATTLVYEINGSTTGVNYDQFSVGTIVPGNATVSLVLDPGYVPLVGQEFVLLKHNFVSIPFPGTFASISEGSTRALAPGIIVTFSYLGGDGNDFTATVTSSPAGEFRVWDGGGGDNNWTTAANWVGDFAPQPDEALRFAAGAARTTNTNNFPLNTTFRNFLIEGGYTLGGNGLQLSGDLKANITGSSTLNLPVRLLNDSDFATLVELQGPGSLIVAGSLTVVDSTKLTLRRIDPVGTLIGTLDIAAILKDAGATSIGVFVEGGGKTRFTPAIRDYDQPTEVTHGILEITGVNGGVPGDLKIGGGAFPASVENPGGTDGGVGRISDTATLTLLTNGTHILVGANPIEQVGKLVFAGGLRVQPATAKFRVRDLVEISANTNIQVGQPIVYSIPSGDLEDQIQVAETASALITSSIQPDTAQILVLGKYGTGPLRVSGFISGSELRAYEGFVGPVDGGSLQMAVSLRGGTLGGNSTVNGAVTGTTAGGTVAPGGITPATRFGILSISGNLLPVAQSTFSFEIGGITPGTQHDQISMNGSDVDLNSAALVIQLANNFIPTPGQTFRIINKNTIGTIIRTFAGKPEGNTFQTAGFNWTITYAGGDGNDVILTAGSPAVEIGVEQPTNTLIADDGQVNFGSVNTGSNADLSFTIRNSGGVILNLTGTPKVAITGTDAAQFTVTAQPAATVAASGGTTNFTVRFTPTSISVKSAQLVIDNNDADENPYNISLTGFGLAPVAAPLAFGGTPILLPSNGVDGARVTTAVTGPPGALVRLESSGDLGLTIPWLTISAITLDGSGQGNFSNVADPRTVATAPAAKHFFRLVID